VSLAAVAVCGGTVASSHGPELAYSLDRETDTLHGGIFVSDENGNRRMLVGNTPPQAIYGSAVWSPRGDRILFEVETGGGDLFETVRPDGSDRRVLGSGTGISWSPNGRLLALVHEKGRIDLLRPLGRRVRTLRIRVGPEDLTEGAPSWSPDGTRLATQVTTMKYKGDVFPSTIFTLPTSGTGHPTALHGPGPTDTDSGPDWSPDGKSIAFSRSTATTEDEVWLMRADGSGRRHVTTGTTGFAWSADGSSLLLELSRPGQRGVYAFPAAGGRPRRIGRLGRGLLASHGRYRTRLGDYVSWAPGGRRLVRIDGDGRIVVSRPDGSHRRRLTDPFAPVWPKWSPDGMRIAYNREYPVQLRDPGLYVKAVDGGAERRIGEGFLLHWSSDGRRLLVLVDGFRSFELLDVASGKTVVGPVRGRSPALSPNGATLAFVRDHHDEYGNSYDSILYLFHTAGGASRLLAQVDPVHKGLAFDTPVWAPDGTSLFVEQFDPVGGVEATIRQLPVDGQAGKVLASERLSALSNLSVSPRGDRLAFATESGVETLDLADGTRRKVPQTPPGELNQLAWSPDGEQLAYLADDAEAPGGGLFVIGADGSGRKLVSLRTQAVDFFDWRPVASAARSSKR
jgi:Tol biopolymer transport system component